MCNTLRRPDTGDSKMEIQEMGYILEGAYSKKVPNAVKYTQDSAKTCFLHVEIV